MIDIRARLPRICLPRQGIKIASKLFTVKVIRFVKGLTYGIPKILQGITQAQNLIIYFACQRFGKRICNILAAVSKQIKPALTYIRENYHDPQLITESLIAAHCGISVSRFRNLFKKDIGMTLPQYINHTRLSAAIHLLETTNKSIAEIATESGFFEVAYFNRVFRKYFGMSPKEMRKKRQHKY